MPVGSPPETEDRKNSDPADAAGLDGPASSGRGETHPPGLNDATTPVQSATAARATAGLSLGMPPMKGDYRPVRQLGAGSFGEVWLAEEWVDGRNFRQVAVKFLDKSQEQAGASLFLEASRLVTLAGMGGVVHIHEIVLDVDRPYFTMDYAPEGSLAGLLAKRGALPVEEALELFRGIVAALESLHYKGIIHCDLKPENILLGERRKPMIADFGQARLRGKGPPNTGSWFYMAPEQIAEGDAHDAETSCDVYALGAIIYKMLTGREPRACEEARSLVHGELSVREKLKAHRDWILKAPAPVEHHRIAAVDTPLRAIIDRCLQTDPAHRFRDGPAVSLALSRRDHLLRKRPAIVRGLFATAILLGVLLGVLIGVVPRILREFRDAYVKESQRRDWIAARLASDVVEDTSLDRMKLVESWAADPAIRNAVAGNKSQLLFARLIELFEGKRAEKHAGKSFDVRALAVYDARGRRLAIVTGKAETSGVKNDPLEPILMNWRDWFHGMDGDQKPIPEPYPPTEQTKITSPYTGYQITNGNVEPKRVVTFSAPIRTGDGPILGVLSITNLVENLCCWTGDTDLLEKGLITIVDKKGHCVWHNDLRPLELASPDAEMHSEPFPQDRNGVIVMAPAPIRRTFHPIYPEYLRLFEEAGLPAAGAQGPPPSLADLKLVTDDQFRDPINRGTYLASFALMPRIGWGLLVQHKRADALKDFETLSARIIAVGWVSFLAVSAVVVTLWGVILRRWNREVRFAHA